MSHNRNRRKEQLQVIDQYLASLGGTCILCGDFNFCCVKDIVEISNIPGMIQLLVSVFIYFCYLFICSFLNFHCLLSCSFGIAVLCSLIESYTDCWSFVHPGVEGWTEDTTRNRMRYILKPVAKHVRYDRIYLTAKERLVPLSIELIGTQACTAENPEVFPSDHFGLRATFCRPRQMNLSALK
jgi:hypothetical protein